MALLIFLKITERIEVLEISQCPRSEKSWQLGLPGFSSLKFYFLLLCHVISHSADSGVLAMA